METAVVDAKTGRKCYLDVPSRLAPDEEVTFVLSLHGGGSVGRWQREYFPVCDYVDKYRLVVATPSAATKEPTRHWAADADDEYLVDLVESVLDRLGRSRVRGFWLAGHSQGGMTAHRLLAGTGYFADRVDGWLSLSGGRLGPAERAPGFGPPRTEEERRAFEEAMARRGAFQRPPTPAADFSFIFIAGEHEIAWLPETSPWAERYGAGPRIRQADVVDDQPGKVHDARYDANPTLSWGRKPAPGTAQVYLYPNGRDGRVIADVVRLGKGHTEGLEPRVTEELVKLMVSAPGGKVRALSSASAQSDGVSLRAGRGRLPAVDIGVVFPQTEIGGDVGAVRAYALAVGELGFAHVLAYDHVLGADPAVHRGWDGPYDVRTTFHEPFVLYGYLAALTSLELVTGIIILPQRQTAVVAKQAAEVDLLTGGKFRLGVGLGWNAVEYEALGKNFGDRGRRMPEQIALLRRLWTEQSVTFTGSYETVTGAGLSPLPVQRPIPVWLGAQSRPAYVRIGQLADGWFPQVPPGPRLEEARAIIGQAAAETGRDPARIGMEGMVSWRADRADGLADDVGRWHAAGASHVSISTMGAGLGGVDGHIGALTAAAAALGLTD